MSRNDAVSLLESLNQEPIVEYGFMGDSIPDFQVHDNPAVLRAFGMSGSQTAQVWQSDRDEGESEFLLNGKPLILSVSNTAVIVPLPGLYFLKLSGMDGNVRIVKQLTEMARSIKQVVVQQAAGTGSTNLDVANRTSTTLDVTSDTGTDATIPFATTSLAGLMTAADKTRLDNTLTLPQVFVHTQSVPSTEWIVNHNLGFHPDVFVEDLAGNKVESEVANVSLAQTRIRSVSPSTGLARFT